MLNFYRVLVVLFALLLIGPSSLWFFLQPADYDGTIDLTENRLLAQAPEFTARAIRQFPAQFDSFFSDHLPFRSDLIEIFAAMEYAFFDRFISSNVIVGEEGWLFYSNPADGNSVNSYKGVDHFTQEELAIIAANLTAARDKMEGMGIEFVVMFPPNKENIYPEYMPDSIKVVNPENRLDLLVDYLRENTDLRIVYPKDALLAEKAVRPVYYHQDSHWNYLGAYVGTLELLNELGIENRPLSDVVVASGDAVFSDLRNMGRLDRILGDDVDWRIGGFSDYTSEVIEVDGNNVIRMRSNNPNGKKLLIQRDSFATAMTAYLPSYFEETLFVHWNVFDPAVIEAEMPDVFVMELVERSLPMLLNYAL